jgi:hypothetical protein
LVGSSPRTIAASHVLHRPPVPRHPPSALNNLTTQMDARVHYAILNKRPTHNPNTPPHQGRQSRAWPKQPPPQGACFLKTQQGAGQSATQKPTTIPTPTGGKALLRKEVIQPHLPVRLPCYDFVPIASPTFDGSLPPKRVRPPASGVADFRDVTGGVYKARERIHRSVADLRLLATPTSRGRVADPDPN